MDIRHQLFGTSTGEKIARVTLDAPKKLNALSLNMIQQLQRWLDEWRDQPDIVMVWLEGAGGKAFCAGGDVVSIYRLLEDESEPREKVASYFDQEYRLDYTLHCYSKPVLVWADGYVMGGGVGLMQGASHRLVTETTRFAMPEMNIGLFPDVGASYFLSRLADKFGLWLGLTASQLNSADLVEYGLADHQLNSKAKDKLFQLCIEYNWQASDHAKQLSALIKQVAEEEPAMVEYQIKPLRSVIDPCLEGDSAAEVCQAISQLSQSDSKLLQAAAGVVNYGSPITAAVFWEQMSRGASLTLAECFDMERRLVTNVVLEGDFREGVRALLVDKSRDPNWRFAAPADIDPAFITHLFER